MNLITTVNGTSPPPHFFNYFVTAVLQRVAKDWTISSDSVLSKTTSPEPLLGIMVIL